MRNIKKKSEIKDKGYGTKGKGTGFCCKKGAGVYGEEPEENLLKLLQRLETFDVKGTLREQMKVVRPIISNQENNGNQYNDLFIWVSEDTERKILEEKMNGNEITEIAKKK